MIPQLQTNAATFLGRYWTETTLLRRYFPSDRDLSILSFGCSTGEELLFLRKLFPKADLFGCDHDWSSLMAARALLADEATIFDSGSETIDRFGPFDIIVCNSVLLSHTVKGSKGPRALPAAVWSDSVAKLDAALKPGGVLQIVNSNIPFRFHSRAADYTPLRSPLILGPHFVDQFDLDGRHLCSGVSGTGLSAMTNLHLAGPHWHLLQPGDLVDVHFQKAGGRTLTAIPDQRLPNLRNGAAAASGSATFGRARPVGETPATSLKLTFDWTVLAGGGVRIERTAQRTWFDGTDLPEETTTIEMEGAEATAFIESLQGRPSTRIQLDALNSRRPTRAPSF